MLGRFLGRKNSLLKVDKDKVAIGSFYLKLGQSYSRMGALSKQEIGRWQNFLSFSRGFISFLNLEALQAHVLQCHSRLGARAYVLYMRCSTVCAFTLHTHTHK